MTRSGPGGGESDQATATICEIVLSPHLDDATLSLGHVLARATDPVVVVAFAGRAVAETAIARQFAVWAGYPPETDLGPIRRAEERLAMARLGVVDFHHLDLVDALYRKRQDGAPLCVEWDDLWSAGVEDLATQLRFETELQSILDAQPSGRSIRVHAPISIGNHRDHQIVRRAAEAVIKRGLSAGRDFQLALYEDFPYAVRFGDEARLAHVPAGMTGNVAIPLAGWQVDKWIWAAEAYKSQMKVLFEEFPGWRESFRSAVSDGGSYVARLWSPDRVNRLGPVRALDSGAARSPLSLPEP